MRDRNQTSTCLELFLDLRGPTVTASSLHSLVMPLSEDSTVEHTRYNIHVSGLDENRYPVLARLDPVAKTMSPILFGLSYLGTNRFDHDFAAMVSRMNDEDL